MKPRILSGLALGLIILTLFSCQENPSTESSTAGFDSANNAEFHSNSDSVLAKGDNSIPFAEAEAFFEFNTTDNDLGLQIFLDAEGWEKVHIYDANWQKIVKLSARGPLAEIGITELRFESAEPSPEEVLALFPPGEYRFDGTTVEGQSLFSAAELSHDFLEAPTVSPSDGEEVDSQNVVVSWEAPEAELVEIIIESEETDNVFDVTVEADISELTVPPQFLEAGTEYKLEVLVVAENGNRTITETTFVTAE